MLIDRALKALMILCLFLWILCFLQRERLPDPSVLDPHVLSAPVQTSLQMSPFTRNVDEIVYTIKPLYEYDLYGLVVSQHDSKAFWDWIHAAANDRINVIDLCVVWGDDARRGSYRDIAFSSGEFTCYFQPRTAQAAQDFDIYQISNNHLLTEDARLARLLRSVHVGDEVHFHGYLSEYEHDYGFHFHRGTSVTRFDTGDGACETVYVTDANIIRSHDRLWRLALWFSGLGLVGACIAWLMRPAKLYE